MTRAWLLVVIAACGKDDAPPPGEIDAPPIDIDAPDGDDAPPGSFVLTSPAFVEGGAIPAEHSCDGADNVSPQLDWVGAPAGTMSFAVTLIDRTNGLAHSAIYDIPSTATGLPADVDKEFAPADVPDAHQSRTFGNAFGYAGPCPPAAQDAHEYEFAVHALDVALLPNVTMNSSAQQVVVEIGMHDLASALLNGTYDRN